jgi:mannose-6-phosphate isomerase-like protein (cupin superfamily)
MSNVFRLLVALVLLSANYFGDQTPAYAEDTKAVVLQRGEGEARTRRPREGVASPATEFVLKIGPRTNASKHLLVFTEELAPGARIPRHRHHGEDEILLVQTGSAHVWLGDKEYDALAGALIFIPADTWISLKNTGKENISLVAIWNEPEFEEMLLCGSTPKGQKGPLLSRDDVKDCYHHGDAELDVARPPTSTKP